MTASTSIDTGSSNSTEEHSFREIALPQDIGFLGADDVVEAIQFGATPKEQDIQFIINKSHPDAAKAFTEHIIDLLQSPTLCGASIFTALGYIGAADKELAELTLPLIENGLRSYSPRESYAACSACSHIALAHPSLLDKTFPLLYEAVAKWDDASDTLLIIATNHPKKAKEIVDTVCKIQDDDLKKQFTDLSLEDHFRLSTLIGKIGAQDEAIGEVLSGKYLTRLRKKYLNHWWDRPGAALVLGLLGEAHQGIASKVASPLRTSMKAYWGHLKETDNTKALSAEALGRIGAAHPETRAKIRPDLEALRDDTWVKEWVAETASEALAALDKES